MRIGNKVFATIAFALTLLISFGATAATTKKKAAPAASKAPARSYSIAQDPYIGAIALDAATGRVLFEQNADAKGYPASVLKLMDLLILLEKMEKGQLSLQDQVPVSRKSALTGGSQVWLAEKESFTVEEMLYALMIQSANDAAVALAEKAAGSTEGFVELMNQKAAALGMKSTRFNSVHGLPPSPGQGDDTTTARDLSILAREVAKRPEALKYTSTKERPFRTNNPKATVVMRTHNHLLEEVAGCDGLKTGYITKAGYSIAVTAARNGQRVVVVVLGSKDRKLRDRKAAEIVNKAFAAMGSQPAATPASIPAPARPAAKR
jgi:D-alanyl-D-alanine carboxypeptidase (penicillin-binding protein 5/6)